MCPSLLLNAEKRKLQRVEQTAPPALTDRCVSHITVRTGLVYGGSNTDEATCIQQTTDGGYVISTNRARTSFHNSMIVEE